MNTQQTQTADMPDVPEGPEGPQQDRPGGRPMGLERFQKRNPDPKPEPALGMARTQAEWHEAQQALLDSQTPPEERVIHEAEMEGIKPSEAQSEAIRKKVEDNSRKKTETAKQTLEQMRQGDFRGGGGARGQSGLSPASTPGYVPAPVQGQTPPVPGQPIGQTPDHRESHHLTAQAHSQAAQIHQQEADRNPANQPGHARAAETHRQQAQAHEAESRSLPDMPGVPAPDADKKPETKPGKK
jgi:hypothetical protein